MRLATAAPATLEVETRRLFWTAGIVLGATLPHWSALPAWVPVLLATAIAWRLAIAAFAWPVPLRLLRLVLAFAAFCAVLFQYRTINGVAAGSALLVVMIALKFLESNGHRDRLVLIMISYFLLFASLLTENGPLTAAYLLLLLWFTTVGLLQLSRRGSLLGARDTGVLAARLLAQSLPLMVVLFVLFPRLPGPIWAIPGSTSSGATGLGDEMSPGDITNLALSDEIAFRVEFSSPVPRARELYWRGPTMANFNGRTWSRLIGEQRGERVANSTEYFGEPTEYRVMLEPRGRNWAFGLDMPRTWSGERGVRIGMGSDYQLRVFGDGARSNRFEYRVTSHTSFRAREPLTPGQREQFTDLPPATSPRTRELVRGWVAEDSAPLQVIESAMGYLRSEPFFYTLTPPALGSSQPVDEFLFQTREGFCEHYASAFTVMMRAAGIPARVVSGYQGGELNSLGSYYVIRQSDAHAWTEVWLADEGWVRVDPVSAVAPERVALGSWRTALGGDRVPGTAFGRIPWVRRTLLAWDAATTYWNDWIVGYGPDAQRALLDALGLDTARRSERWTKLLALSVSATLAGSLALSLFLFWRQRRRAPLDAAARSFATFSQRLAKLAVPLPATGEAPLAYAARAQGAVPHAAADIAAIVAAYLRARYEPDADRGALGGARGSGCAVSPGARLKRAARCFESGATSGGRRELARREELNLRPAFLREREAHRGRREIHERARVVLRDVHRELLGELLEMRAIVAAHPTRSDDANRFERAVDAVLVAESKRRHLELQGPDRAEDQVVAERRAKQLRGPLLAELRQALVQRFELQRVFEDRAPKELGCEARDAGEHERLALREAVADVDRTVVV